MSEQQENWVSLPPSQAGGPGELKTFRHEERQIVTGRTQDGMPFALDNKCPHEGYALAQGDLKGCHLTCTWHNWKFDVRDGTCVLGGEAVRSYPVRDVNGTLQINVADPDPDIQIATLRESLKEGLFKNETGRCIRDGIRLLKLGVSPHDLLLDIATYDALHAEYGTTHALPVAADCGRLVDRADGVDAMYAIAQAMDYCGDVNQRMAPRKRPTPQEGAALEKLRRLAEEERVEEAEALLLGAFDSGKSRKEIEEWLHVIFADHFVGFGHPLIYLVKAQELLDRVNGAGARDIYASLLVRYILGTREDILPYMRPCRQAMDAMASRWDDLWLCQNENVSFDEAAFRSSVLDDTPTEACATLQKELERGVPWTRLARSLTLAGAERMLRFDPRVEQDPHVAENWVWVTHRFTHAQAVEKTLERHPGPAAGPYLFHALAFINSGRRMDVPREEQGLPSPRSGSLDDLKAALGQHEVNDVLALGQHLLRDPAKASELKTFLEDLSLQDVVVRPIVVAHLIKITAAAVEMSNDCGPGEQRELGLLALLRFLALGHRERRVHDQVTTSITWVVEGKIPRKLTM